MGSKGATTTKQQQSNYTANPAVSGAGTQALSMGADYANSPFQIPTAPVAGFSGDQQNAFQGVRNAQGMAQPYFDQASAYANQSASPISQGEISQYLNPYASYAMAGLNDTLGSQNTQLQGNLVQTAGGVGADRIGVAQGEKFRQDQLARGQLQSGFYQQALGAAQQDRGRQGAAASLFGYFGPAAQNASLQGSGALLNSGGMQQQQSQAELNAPYQNLLASISDPAQKAQFLASLAGGLGPALGGNTNMTGSETKPGPSIWSQALGLGAAGLGAYMGMPSGGMGGKGSGGGNYGGSPDSNAWLNPATYGNIRASGGRVNPFSMGGGITPEMAFRPMADGGDAEDIPLPPPRPPQYPGGAFGGMPGWDPSEKPMGWDDNTAPGLGPRPGPPMPPKGNFLGPRNVSALPFTDEGEEEAPQGFPSEIPQTAQPTAGDAPPSMSLPGEGGGEEQDFSSRMAQSPWLALAYAGAKTAAGTSPYAGVNIGAGAAGGIEMLGKQQTAAMQAKRVDLEGKRLFQQMAETQRAHSETERWHRETSADRKTSEARLERLERQRLNQPFIYDRDPVTNAPKYAVHGPDGEMLDPVTRKKIEGSPTAPPSGPDEKPKSVLDGPLPQGWSRDAVENAAQTYFKTGKVPGSITGRPGYVVKPLIQSRAAEIMKEQGISPEDMPGRWQRFGSQQLAWNRFTSGPQGNTIRSLGVIVDHVQTALELSRALKNRDIPAFNAVRQKWAEITGKPAPTNIDTAAIIIGPELIKALGVAGAGSEDERKEAGRILNRAKSPAQIEEGISKVVQPLLVGQVEGIKRQFKVSTGVSQQAADDIFNEFMPNSALKFFKKGDQQAPEDQGPKKTEKPTMPPKDRFNELINSGMKKEDAYKKMREEGY